MKTVCLIAAALLWFLHAIGVSGESFSLVWCGASLIVLSFALGGGFTNWRNFQ